MAPQYGTSLTGAGNVATICHIIRPDDKTRTLCGVKVDWRFGKGEGHAGWNLCVKCEAIAGPVIPAPPAPYSYQVEIQSDDNGEWTTDGLRFATSTEARTYGGERYGRFVADRAWRVWQVAKAPTHSLDDKGQVRFLTGGPYAGEQGIGGQQG